MSLFQAAAASELPGEAVAAGSPRPGWVGFEQPGLWKVSLPVVGGLELDEL